MAIAYIRLVFRLAPYPTKCTLARDRREPRRSGTQRTHNGTTRTYEGMMRRHDLVTTVHIFGRTYPMIYWSYEETPHIQNLLLFPPRRFSIRCKYARPRTGPRASKIYILRSISSRRHDYAASRGLIDASLVSWSDAASIKQ